MNENALDVVDEFLNESIEGCQSPNEDAFLASARKNTPRLVDALRESVATLTWYMFNGDDKQKEVAEKAIDVIAANLSDKQS